MSGCALCAGRGCGNGHQGAKSSLSRQGHRVTDEAEGDDTTGDSMKTGRNLRKCTVPPQGDAATGSDQAAGEVL